MLIELKLYGLVLIVSGLIRYCKNTCFFLWLDIINTSASQEIETHGCLSFRRNYQRRSATFGWKSRARAGPFRITTWWGRFYTFSNDLGL